MHGAQALVRPRVPSRVSWRSSAIVTILFQHYELVANSGLFDAAYYLHANPDVVALSSDPLLHFLEHGAAQHRNPSDRFDTGHYLAQCIALGELPQNPVLHYLMVGAKQGLTPLPNAPSGAALNQLAFSRIADAVETASARTGKDSSTTERMALFVDVPRINDGLADSQVCNALTIAGWAFSPDGVESIVIEVNGRPFTTARHGSRRPDVAAAHPTWRDALHSGYSAHLSTQGLDQGRHHVTITLIDRAERTLQTEFDIDVQDSSERRDLHQLRRKMTHAEASHHLDVLDRFKARPQFKLVLPWRTADTDAVRSLLDNLRSQIYSNWELYLVPYKHGRHATPLHSVPRKLLEGFEDIAAKIRVLNGRKSQRESTAQGSSRCFAMRVAVGDELGCDALLELALASAFAPEVELMYCDERCANNNGRMQVFFKPAWSPDLLLSTNYLHRAWCINTTILKRAGLSLADLIASSEYDLTLRLTELTRHIEHVPKLLYQSNSAISDTSAQQRAALSAALTRRGIAGEVRAGHAKNCYRIKSHVKPARVSIIVQTSDDQKLTRCCIESLRAHHEHVDCEIICVGQNAVVFAKQSAGSQQHADVMVGSPANANWSQKNNSAAARSSGQYLLFLSAETQSIDNDWLHALIEHAERTDVGAVGPLLLYPDRSVQQAGLFVDALGRPHPAFRHCPADDPGYFGLALTQRNVLAVSGACLMTRRETFEQLNGFDDTHSASDIDYCMRAWRKGLVNIFTPYARLIYPQAGSPLHSAPIKSQLKVNGDLVNRELLDTLNQDHGGWNGYGDPYFNCNLSARHDAFTAEAEPIEILHPGHPKFDRTQVRRILVVKLDHLGDCITSIPAINRLKELFPQAHLTVLAGKATRAIWNSVASVNEVIEFNFFHARSSLGTHSHPASTLQALSTRLRSQRFDLAIDLRKQPDTRAVLELSGARTLVGFDHQGKFTWLDIALEWDEDVPSRVKHGHISDDLMALVEAIAAHSAPRTGFLRLPPRTTGLSFLNSHVARRLLKQPLVCIHPAAGNPLRHWPARKFAELINLLMEREAIHVALIGSADEAAVAEEIRKHCRHQDAVFDLMKCVSLEQLPALLSHTCIFIGNNSGPQHLSAAYGVPTVCIHGGVIDANEWGPAGPTAVAIRRAMSCSPCFIEREADCPRGLACLNELPATSVARVCLDMLRSRLHANTGTSLERSYC